MKTSFAERLAAEMAAKGLTQSELARLIGTRQSTISGWLHGVRPRWAAIAPLARVFGVTTEWLLDGSESAAPTVADESKAYATELLALTASLREVLSPSVFHGHPVPVGAFLSLGSIEVCALKLLAIARGDRAA